ncbi:Transglutaminase-like superfamily protein [Chitinophaga sp. YR573]|uniref:lasso peptide biosynthesis B2 protein n=1 Tax=Chitinophaga sp. YR573 TaxID=1881040 RepID=UPI0008D03A62|nr:lasso peptide biosynthesis B2 protein [Chitinophaga sp. YR573]SEW44103.1 Transglutaminase-like superfamily protein [Chitinophaga sp. YR573]
MRNKISIRNLLLFAEAWLLLAMARLILIFIPFRKIARLLGEKIATQLPLPSTKSTQPLQQNIRIAISRASKFSPWRTACFEQALAAKIMLKNRKTVSIVYFGVRKKNTTLAHAWLESGGITVTGGRNSSLFSVIAAFKS